jgi:hypothetical protein
MSSAKPWLRFVGAFYVVQFLAMAVVRAPIRAQAPDGTLALAAAGDPLARFLVDTWVTFGLEVGAIGVAALVATRLALDLRALVLTIIAIEIGRGIVADVYMLARGQAAPVLVVWLVIHASLIVTGLRVLRRSAAG